MHLQNQPDYLHNLFSVFSLRVKLAPHMLSTQLDHLYLPHYKSPPTALLDKHHITMESASFFIPSTSFCSLSSWTPGSPHPAHITLSQSPPSFSPSITPSAFYSRLKTHLFLQILSSIFLVPSALSSWILNLCTVSRLQLRISWPAWHFRGIFPAQPQFSRRRRLSISRLILGLLAA